MATKAFPLTRTPVKVAADTDDPVLCSPSFRDVKVAYSATATDVAPATTGGAVHRLLEHETMSRLAVGDGFLWAWVWDERVSTTDLAVSGSSVTP